MKSEEETIEQEPDVEQEISEEVDEILNSNKSIILYNDDHNTFDHVIKCLVDICEHEPMQAEQCAHIVHFKGKCSVKEGSKEDLKPKKDQLVDKGLNANIE